MKTLITVVLLGTAAFAQSRCPVDLSHSHRYNEVIRTEIQNKTEKEITIVYFDLTFSATGRQGPEDETKPIRVANNVHIKPSKKAQTHWNEYIFTDMPVFFLHPTRLIFADGTEWREDDNDHNCMKFPGT